MTLLTPPVLEPVTVAEAKFAARLDGAHWDTPVAQYITAAREVAEHETGRRFIAQQWRLELEDWPLMTDKLPFFMATVVAVRYWTGAAWAPLTYGTHYAWAHAYPGIVLVPELNTSWPTLGEVAVGPRVRVDVTLGAADAAAVPATAKQFINAMVAVMAADPTLTAMDALASSAYLPRMLDSLRLYR